MSTSLYIGRFQPFHNGHLDAVKQALKKTKHLIIGIGSAEDCFMAQNPFTTGERYQMIDETLKAEGVSRDTYSIIPIRNIDNYALWVQHVELYCPPFKDVFTGSRVVKELFEAHAALSKFPHKVVSLNFNEAVSATEVRERMLNGKEWHHLLPKTVTSLLVKWKAEERIKMIQNA